jgi:hypothetical protein
MLLVYTMRLFIVGKVAARHQGMSIVANLLRFSDAHQKNC